MSQLLGPESPDMYPPRLLTVLTALTVNNPKSFSLSFNCDICEIFTRHQCQDRVA
jgi:hypothetical protein